MVSGLMQFITEQHKTNFLKVFVKAFVLPFYITIIISVIWNSNMG